MIAVPANTAPMGLNDCAQWHIPLPQGVGPSTWNARESFVLPNDMGRYQSLYDTLAVCFSWKQSRRQV